MLFRSHEGNAVDGLTQFDKRTILLEMSLEHDIAKETIIHEMMHCLLEGVGLDERHFDQVHVSTTNEQLATVISVQLMSLQHLNQKLFKVLFG